MHSNTKPNNRKLVLLILYDVRLEDKYAILYTAHGCDVLNNNNNSINNNYY